MANFRPTSGIMAQCPNQAQWIAVIPLRYGIQQKHGDSFKPQKLRISGLKSLQKHEYVPRPLMPGFIYLYSHKQGHILEAEYGDAGIPIATGCAAGEAPAQALSSSSLLAEKDDTIELLYSPCPLPQSLINAFQQNSVLRGQYFSTVSVTAARGNGTANASPLFHVDHFLADNHVGETQFDWSIQSVLPGARNRLLAAGNRASFNNHIAVVLPDPITITTELALLFDAQYDVAMTSIAQTQHAHSVGKVTEALLNSLTQKDFDRHVLGYTVKSVNHDRPLPGRIHNPHNIELAYPLIPLYGYDTHVIPRSEDEIHAAKLQNRARAQYNYREQLNYDRMQSFLDTRDDFTRNLGKVLDEEAADWLKWLNSDDLNKALAFYTAAPDPVPEQLHQLEAALSNMTLNLQVSSKGAALRDRWVDTFIVNLNPDEQFAEQQGAGWHILLMLSGKAFQEANKINKELITASGIDYSNLSRAYTDLFSTGGVKASLATDQLNVVFGERLAQLGVHANAEAAFMMVMQRQSWRYGYGLHTVQHKMLDMLQDMHNHQQAAFNHHIGTQRTALATAISHNAVINTFNLAEPAPAGKIEKAVTPFAKWFVNQADRAGLVQSDSLVVKGVEKAGQTFEPFANKGLGILFLGQVYNLYAVTTQFNSTKTPVKHSIDFLSASAGVIQTSLAIIQKTMFGGSEAAMKAAAKTLLHDIGVKTHANVKALGFTSLKNIEQTVATRTFMSKLLVNAGRTSYKMLPVVGNLLAVISSGFNIHRDFNKDEALLTQSVGIASGAVNTLALGCAIVALVSPAAPLVAVTGIVLAVAGIALDLWHSYLQASDMELFLRGTFWGKDNDYQYNKALHDIGSRLEYYEDLNDSTVQATAEQELLAFCHQLYKPILSVDNYAETDYGQYENFTLNVNLPGFDPGQGQAPYFKLTARHKGARVTLFESNQPSQIPAEHKVYILDTGTSYVQVFKLNETKKQMDFDDYQLELKHYHPANFPVTLHYIIDIDDDSKIPFFTQDVSFEMKRVNA